MSELGTRLKEARLSKKLSLDDLQEVTKIQKRYLIGIEEGNYSLMPGTFYVRAFIKQYAEAVGLDPDELFEEYKSDLPSTNSEDLPGQLSRVQTKELLSENRSKFIDLLPKLIIVAVVIAVIFFVWWILSKNAGNEPDTASENKSNQEVTYEQSEELEKDNPETENNEKPEEAQTEEETTEPDEPVEEPEETVVQELSVVEANGARSIYELKNAEKFELKVVSTGETWVNVKNGNGKSFFQGLMKTGGTESQTFDLSQETEVTIVAGRSSDTEIYVNDQKLEYAVSPTEIVRQDITIRYVKTNQ